MIAVRDPAVAARQLAEGHHFGCPWSGCSGSLGPWGSARTRPVRLFGGGTDSYTPKRARCRSCRRTQVVLPTIAFPRRADNVETVFNAITLAANGAGHRKVGAQVGVPETTLQGWLRRARANANTIRANATVVMCALDRWPRGPTRPAPRWETCSKLSDGPRWRGKHSLARGRRCCHGSKWLHC